MSPNDVIIKSNLTVEVASKPSVLSKENDVSPVVVVNYSDDGDIEADDWNVVTETDTPPGCSSSVSQLDWYILVDKCDDDFDAELMEATTEVSSDSTDNDEEEATAEEESPFKQNKQATGQRPDSPVLGPIEFFKKVAVGATGAALLGVGAVLVPCPLPLGIPTMALGAGVLNYEFPETTRKVVDHAKERLVDVLETAEEEGIEIEDLEDDVSVMTRESKTSTKLKKKIGKHVLPWLKKENEDLIGEEQKSASGKNKSSLELQ